jgi:zinc-ribbon domain
MFKKKVCPRCGKGLKDKYDFCPHCGTALEKKTEDFGMLGKDDFFSNNFNEMRLPFGLNFSNIFSALMNSLDKQQLKETEKKTNKPEGVKRNIIINIAGLPVPNQMPTQIENPIRKEPKNVSLDNFSTEKLKKFSALPKEEPTTNIRRLSNKVIYEINLPGVKSAKDISILNLEKGIELKAVSEKKAYLKSIPITLPILAYKLSKGKLVLELDAHED